MKTRYKFLREVDGKIKSDSGNLAWEIGKWEKVDGKLDLCEVGLHCSKNVFAALSYVPGEILAKVQVRGEVVESSDKEAWSEMRVIKAYRWTKKDSVALSIYAAELCIDLFEKQYPEDDRPRKAIEAAKKWLKSPTKKNQDAARAARAAGDAAWAARAAGDAAGAAAGAARAAGDAARAAAWAARAARAAAGAAVIKKINKWMLKRINELEEV